MYVLWIVVCPFVPFLLAIVLSVLLRYTDSDYPLVSLSSPCITKADLNKIIHLAISRNSKTLFQLTTNQCVVNGEKQVIHNIRVGLKSIKPFAPILTLRWSYLLSNVQLHTTTHCSFNREQLDPAPPKASPTQSI